MRSVTFFVLGGGAGGAALGVAYYLLDPLNPDADLKGNILTGMAIGALSGVVFSFVQLNKQVIVPNSPPDVELDEEFQGSLIDRPLERFPGVDPPSNPFPLSVQFGPKRNRSPVIPLLGMIYRF